MKIHGQKHRRPPRPRSLEQWPTCCVRHQREHLTMREALTIPPGTCLLCGSQAKYRTRWPGDALARSLTTKGRVPCGVLPLAEVWVDVCFTCKRAPDLEARIEDALAAQREHELVSRRN